MKTITSMLLTCFMLCQETSLSQTAIKRKASDIIEQKESKMKFYHLETAFNDAIVLPMPYGEPDIISETDKKKIKESQILRIDLVFSDFPKENDFKKLNLKRISAVEKLRKDLVTNSEFEWRIIRQTACSNEAEAKTMFHGIVIHLRPKQDEETTKRDLLAFDAYIPKDTAKKGEKLYDSTLFKIFKRHDKWKDMLIVSDLTGSMTPYTAQLILWFKLTAKDKRVKDVVFFNDGDNKEDKAKIMGKTGGIYHANIKTYEDIVNLAQKTMFGGNGGDGHENDIEALLKGIELVPDAKEIILIADNLAPIKDFALIEKLHKPIRVILCGTNFFINLQYLDLALKTGGSVHTMEEDLEDLIKKNEGDKITFNKRTFQIVKGTFVELKKI